MVYEDLKEYVNAWLGYEDEKRQLREAKNDFKDSFMARTGATKQEIQMLEKALSINKKLETDHEITDFVDKVEKIAEFLKKMAPGNENEPNETASNSLEQMTLDVSDAVASPSITVTATKSSKVASSWNPPPAPVIPKVISKKLKN